MRWTMLTSKSVRRPRIILYALLAGLSAACATPLNINQIQFVGSHNSYKQAMLPADMAGLRKQNPQAAQALDYAHVPLSQQLDLGIRKLEIDVFYLPKERLFTVGHVQQIDMVSHCKTLRVCLSQVRAWSDAHPRHIPIWISFNAKDQLIAGLPPPSPFDALAFRRMDEVLEAELGGRLIRPAEVKRDQQPNWPSLADARGKILLILDEVGAKRDLYWQGWRNRPMFTNAPITHPAAAILIRNDPIAQQEEIKSLVKAGDMVRTRADADTVEARSNDVRRREAAFASGAQAVSTDYYLPASHFSTDYQVKLQKVARCNPVSANKPCWVDG